MKPASIHYRGRHFVVTEIAAGELVGIASIARPPVRAPGCHPSTWSTSFVAASRSSKRSLASLEEIRNDEVGRAHPGRRRALVTTGAPPRKDLRGRDEQLVEQRAQDQRARSSGFLLEARVMSRRTPRADPDSALLRQRAPRARARRRHRPRGARRAGNERARCGLRVHDLQRHHGQRHARGGPLSLLGRLRQAGYDPSQTERVEQHLSYAGRQKGTDTFGAMGPRLVTKDEIAESRPPGPRPAKSVAS